jgi:hypothetical protein
VIMPTSADPAVVNGGRASDFAASLPTVAPTGGCPPG